MYSYELDETSPNQVLNTYIDGNYFKIQFNTAFGIMFATVDVNGTRVKTSCRCVPEGWIIPYMAYVPENCGNFRLICLDANYPTVKNANKTFVLVYYTREEMENVA